MPPSPLPSPRQRPLVSLTNALPAFLFSLCAAIRLADAQVVFDVNPLRPEAPRISEDVPQNALFQFFVSPRFGDITVSPGTTIRLDLITTVTTNAAPVDNRRIFLYSESTFPGRFASSPSIIPICEALDRAIQGSFASEAWSQNCPGELVPGMRNGCDSRSCVWTVPASLPPGRWGIGFEWHRSPLYAQGGQSSGVWARSIDTFLLNGNAANNAGGAASTSAGGGANNDNNGNTASLSPVNQSNATLTGGNTNTTNTNSAAGRNLTSSTTGEAAAATDTGGVLNVLPGSSKVVQNPRNASISGSDGDAGSSPSDSNGNGGGSGGMSVLTIVLISIAAAVTPLSLALLAFCLRRRRLKSMTVSVQKMSFADKFFKAKTTPEKHSSLTNLSGEKLEAQDEDDDDDPVTLASYDPSEIGVRAPRAGPFSNSPPQLTTLTENTQMSMGFGSSLQTGVVGGAAGSIYSGYSNGTTGSQMPPSELDHVNARSATAQQMLDVRYQTANSLYSSASLTGTFQSSVVTPYTASEYTTQEQERHLPQVPPPAAFQQYDARPPSYATLHAITPYNRATEVNARMESRPMVPLDGKITMTTAELTKSDGSININSTSSQRPTAPPTSLLSPRDPMKKELYEIGDSASPDVVVTLDVKNPREHLFPAPPISIPIGSISAQTATTSSLPSGSLSERLPRSAPLQTPSSTKRTSSLPDSSASASSASPLSAPSSALPVSDTVRSTVYAVPKLFRCIHSFEPEAPDELPLDMGDVVAVKQVWSDGWGMGYLHERAKGGQLQERRKEGVVPLNFLTEM
ncbi:hypothetical protein HK102_004061 [Quaeritorhiza haematococci]|nr:hypothetical protein HK102_004061 [Quaeritorhiza haematococci]